MNEMDSAEQSGVWQFMERLHPVIQGVIAFMFLFTIWSVFTGFSLGEIMNKYADQAIQQSEMQFQAQIELQSLQFAATETSNDKLDTLIGSVADVTTRMDDQADRMIEIVQRMGKIEKTVSLVVEWTCDHSLENKPDYCGALNTSILKDIK